MTRKEPSTDGRYSERARVARAAGMSRQQVWRALQLASIPEEEFERLVESDNPPTGAALVRLARQDKPHGRRRPKKRCPHCGGELP